MSDLKLTELDEGFTTDVRRLAERFIDMLNGSSEWPMLKYEAAVDSVAEAMEEAILDITVTTLAQDAEDAFLNSLGQVA